MAKADGLLDAQQFFLSLWCLALNLSPLVHHMQHPKHPSMQLVSHNQISEIKIPDFSPTLFAKFLLINRCWWFLFKSSLKIFCPPYCIKIMLLLLLTHASHTLSSNEKQSNQFCILHAVIILIIFFASYKWNWDK